VQVPSCPISRGGDGFARGVSYRHELPSRIGGTGALITPGDSRAVLMLLSSRLKALLVRIVRDDLICNVCKVVRLAESREKVLVREHLLLIAEKAIKYRGESIHRGYVLVKLVATPLTRVVSVESRDSLRNCRFAIPRPEQ
jgi:hypothetical protein